MSQRLLPPFESFESRLVEQGYDLIAGVDEAGRGCLAGPVVAAACILPLDAPLVGLADSKLLSPLQRDVLYDVITQTAVAWSAAHIDSTVIDHINILRASLEAMRQAVVALSPSPTYLLIDGPHTIDTSFPQGALVRGDRRCRSIAAASILAKVTRDRLMKTFDATYPGFSFSVHKGYGTKQHREEIVRLGPTPIHRLTFRGVLVSKGGPW